MKEGSPDDCFYRLSFSMLTGEASQCEKKTQTPCFGLVLIGLAGLVWNGL